MTESDEYLMEKYVKKYAYVDARFNADTGRYVIIDSIGHASDMAPEAFNRLYEPVSQGEMLDTVLEEVFEDESY